ncbi:MAG: ThiF family adenylyltransferase [Chloroflexi bacterium]|nr:ThiF family adenylyltransferase [Chloroflexota bacterium]
MIDVTSLDLSVSMTAEHDEVLWGHLHKDSRQEDLAFAYWRPSVGQHRYTAVITELVFPEGGDRVLHGNVPFLPEYLRRVLADIPDGCGVAVLHGHPHAGWQGMSHDDVVAERDRIAGAVFGRTRLPLVGLMRALDGAWSGRLWVRRAPRTFERRAAHSVRVVGSRLSTSFHPDEPLATATASQVATVSVWGDAAQQQLVRTRVGIVGLGSVGSLVAEALARMGLRRLTYIDFDRLELRNLDRTVGATRADIEAGLLKVQLAERNTVLSSTATDLDLRTVAQSLLSPAGLAAALDCDVLISCVDRPWPRHLLNALAYSHLIPVVDGGIMARVRSDGTPQHVAWRIHTVGPSRACMVCLGQLRRSDVALDREGKLDDPDYIEGLSDEEKAALSGRNVFPFSMSVATHEVLQLVGLVTGSPRIGGIGPQTYDGYPGAMKVQTTTHCGEFCEYAALTATAADLTPNLQSSTR